MHATARTQKHSRARLSAALAAVSQDPEVEALYLRHAGMVFSTERIVIAAAAAVHEQVTQQVEAARKRASGLRDRLWQNILQAHKTASGFDEKIQRDALNAGLAVVNQEMQEAEASARREAEACHERIMAEKQAMLGMFEDFDLRPGMPQVDAYLATLLPRIDANRIACEEALAPVRKQYEARVRELFAVFNDAVAAYNKGVDDCKAELERTLADPAHQAATRGEMAELTAKLENAGADARRTRLKCQLWLFEMQNKRIDLAVSLARASGEQERRDLKSQLLGMLANGIDEMLEEQEKHRQMQANHDLNPKA